MGLVTGGWGSQRSILWSRLRAVVQVAVCELPAACALLAVVILSGSLQVRDIVLAQVGPGGPVTETGAWPWAWNALRSPQLFVLFLLFFVTALVDGSPTARAARSPNGAGGSLGSAGFFFAEWTHVFVMCALGAIAFLGGYALPGVGARELHASPWLKAAGCGLFLVKCWGLALIVLLLRASLPRIRPDMVLRLGIRTLVPACLVGVGLTALSMRFPLLPSAERTLGLVTMSTVAAGVLLVVASVYASVRSAREEGRLGSSGRARINPYL